MKSQGFDRVRFNRHQQKLLFSSASMKYLPFRHETNTFPLKNIVIAVPVAQTHQEEKIYEWRTKTEFPIAKITHFSLKESNTTNSLFEVEVENFPVKLADLKDISLFKIIYLLKESIIGFERLFHSYGPFMITAKMVALNMANKCKVWLNENFTSNACRTYLFDERTFLASLFRLFKQRSNKLKNTQLFFHELNQCKTFCSALTFIEDYAKINKISILSSCKVTQREIFKGMERKCFQVTLTMNEPPKSLSVNPLRTSLEHLSKNPLLQVLPSFSIKQNEEEYEEISIKLKKSDDTAAELFQKKSSGLEIEDQFFLQNSLFKNDNINEPLARSQLQQKLKSKINFIRKFSDQYPCLSPTQSKTSFASPHKFQPRLPRSKWNQNSFVNCEYEQTAKTANLFTQNNWEKTLNGLFTGTETEQLKKSIHHGKEQRKAGGKFELLDKFGKAIQESFIHEEQLLQN